MTYKWKLQKNIGLKEFTCPKCHGTFKYDEYDLEEDMCDYCLFPETLRSLPTEMGYYYGDPKNITAEREILDKVEFIPETQSKQAIASKQKFEAMKRKKRGSKPKRLNRRT